MIKNFFTDEYFYIACLSAILLALIIFSGPGLPLSLQILRAVFGLLYVLFIPGYCLQAFAMPSRSELDGKERLALSFGLSLALIPALALILDRLPWGITLASVTRRQGTHVRIVPPRRPGIGMLRLRDLVVGEVGDGDQLARGCRRGCQ